MERCLENIGFEREAKTFSPHLTIGRAKKNRKVTVPERLPDFEPVTFEVRSISIMKSTLTPNGPLYEKLSESKLKCEEARDPEP
jgi:2'-5' RNA ligase